MRLDEKRGSVLLTVNVKPNAKATAITDIDDEGVHIQIGAPPKEGEANKELIRFISTKCNVRKSDVSVVQGHKSRTKVVAVITADSKELLKSLVSS
jgi:uncharacterized protein